MGHAGGVFGQAFGGTQAHGKLEHLQCVKEGKGAFASSRHFQSDHRSASLLLGCCGVDVLSHGGQILGPCRFHGLGTAHRAEVVEDVPGRALLVLHPHVQGLHGARQHPGRPRIDGATEEGSELFDLRHDVGVSGGATCDEITVPPEVFGRRVKHQIRTLFQRPLQDGPEVGVVHHDHNAVVFGAVHRSPLCSLADALDLHGGVGGGFQVNDAWADTTSVFKRVLEFVQMRQFGQLSTHRRKHFVQEVVRSAVQRPHKPNGTVRSRPRQQSCGNGCHAASKERGVFAAVPSRQALLGHGHRGVTEAAVDESFGRRLCAFNAVGGLHVCGAGTGVGKHKRRGRMHGRLDRHLGVRRTVPREHCAGFKVLVHGGKLSRLFVV